MVKIFLKRAFTNKIYWLAVVAAWILLLCGIVYTDPMSGTQYTFLSLYYNEEMQEMLEFGQISIKALLMGYGMESYLWMFCPIIVGIPCVLTQKTERFVLFRSSRNRYFLSKYLSNLVLGGCIMVLAYVLFAIVGTPLAQEVVWDSYLLRKFLSVFSQGVFHAVPGVILAEFIRNKYLILCIPFVWNYFVCMFVANVIPFQIWQYISPFNYSMLFYIEQPRMISSTIVLVAVVLICALLIKVIAERRCDCGQK